MRIVSSNGIRQSIWAVACAAALCVVAPAAAPEKFKAGYACRALVLDPASAGNLQRPAALRYRAAPLRICMPDDTNRVAHVAFA